MMRRWFGSLRSFADKVTLLMTLTSGVAIVAVCYTLTVADYLNLRQETLAGLTSQTMIVAMNSEAPLAFNDTSSAVEALSAFQTRPAVAVASLYDLKGTLFASYRRLTGPAPGADAGAGAGLLESAWRRQRTPVEQQGKPLGTLEVVYDMRDLRDHLWRTLALSTIFALVAVILVYLFSLRIRELLIKPIALLSDTVRQVAATRDYSLRARRISDDELGTFTEAFNQMLDQIQQQDLEIQSSRAEALRANQLKDEFLATLSHELRTPMAPIVGWAQILRLRSADNPQLLQAAEVIERNARAQNRIIDDLLDMSRIISGKVKLDVRDIDLADVVRAAVEVVAPSAAAKQIVLEKDIDAGGTACRGDPHRLQQVAWNLLSNAIKFTPSGGRVRIALRREPGRVELTVADTGQGIAAEFLPHVYERFRQADSTNTRHHAGLGLGLAIVKQLVELHGGSVAAASAGADRGATFTVTLPVAGTVPAPAAAARAAESGRGERGGAASLSGVKVLLVDDERDARDLVEHVLTLAGAEVRAVGSAAAALAAFETFQPDLLLSDIAMPQSSGYDLIGQVRALPSAALRGVPAIALTAFARPADAQRALDAGFQRHLAKPVDNDALVAAVAALARSRASDDAPPPA
jgi:signal transduction histidine kinase/ActR/RegA family two-component response regulator